MAKKTYLNRWMNEHLHDAYVKKSKQEGYRSRAAYKLKEVINKDNLIKARHKVLDLGAAPGSWSQVIAQIVGKNGKIIANDILDISPIQGVEFVRGNFTEDAVYKDLLKRTNGQKFDVVLSDMAPNMSGQLSVDMPKSIYLCELVLEISIKTLTVNGSLFIKVFQGTGFDHFVNSCKTTFKKVNIRKPKASRARSKEIYLLANGLKQ